MKKLLLAMVAVVLMMANGAASAREVIIGTDVVALNDNITNMFYQTRAFAHSAFRISAASSNSTSSSKSKLTAGVGFRFYIERYANSPYIEADALFGDVNESGAKLGIDLKVGNLIFDPYVSTLSRSFGFNVGLSL